MTEYIVRYENEYFKLSRPDNMHELIRCKDCKYRGNKTCPFYQKYQGEKYDDWFCADGMRKDS